MKEEEDREKYVTRGASKLYSSPDIIRTIKSRRMKWAEQTECLR
jgi:hypothetical protein